MKGLNSLLDKTDNDKLKGIQEKLSGVVEKAKEGDIGGAIQSGTEGSKLEEFGGLSSQIVKKVKEGENLDALKSASDALGDKIGGE